MSEIEQAAAVIRQLQEALSLHASMVAGGEQASDASTKVKLDAHLRAKQWLDSLELPEHARDWPQYMQRVWVEKQELDERAKKCSEFIGHSPLFETLPLIDQSVLKDQCEVMWQYSEILGYRIDRFINGQAKADGPLLMPEFSPEVAEIMRNNALRSQAVEYPVTPAIVAREGEGLTLDKLVAAVEAAESITRLETIEITATNIQEAYRQRQNQLSGDSKQRLDRFKQAAQPLIDYLREFGSPHVKAIVEPDYAELVEGILGFNADPKWQSAGLRPAQAT